MAALPELLSSAIRDVFLLGERCVCVEFEVASDLRAHVPCCWVDMAMTCASVFESTLLYDSIVSLLLVLSLTVLSDSPRHHTCARVLVARTV